MRPVIADGLAAIFRIDDAPDADVVAERRAGKRRDAGAAVDVRSLAGERAHRPHVRGWIAPRHQKLDEAAAVALRGRRRRAAGQSQKPESRHVTHRTLAQLAATLRRKGIAQARTPFCPAARLRKW